MRLRTIFRYTPALHDWFLAEAGVQEYIRLAVQQPDHTASKRMRRRIPEREGSVEFCILRAGRPIAAAAGLAFLLTGLSIAPPALAQQADTAQAGGQGQQQSTAQTQKNWKDRAEYELFENITKTTDPQQRLQLLNTWQDKYPQSDYADYRLKYYINTLGQLAQNDPSQRQPLIDKCEALLKLDPNDFYANFYVVLYGPQIQGTPSPELVSQVQNSANTLLKIADTVFSPSNKKPQMTDQQWQEAKNSVLAIAHNGLAWVDIQNKNTAGAENEYQQSLTINPNQGTIAAAYAKLLYDDKKFPQALFEYARAAEYDGQGALPANTRTQLLDFFNKAYKDYHGSSDGADQVLNQAKTSAVPPQGFNIVSAAQIANQEAEQLNQRIQNDPAFNIWYSIKQSLQQQGDEFFNSDLKDAEVPGGAKGVKYFTGTVISVDPSKVTLGIENPTVPDATLVFSTPLSQEALNSIKVGSQIQFSGVVDSYTANPYMLTFKDPTIPGVKTTTPAKTGRRRPTRR